jgi:hypothetical protein
MQSDGLLLIHHRLLIYKILMTLARATCGHSRVNDTARLGQTSCGIVKMHGARF